MQYWKPVAPNEFAGDMMPFWDGRLFHLYYLLDRAHHAEQGGLGGHQWAHASTSDLVSWHQHPLAIPRGVPGTLDQNGICTGSILEHEGVYHALYPTRIRLTDGSVAEVLCLATSFDLFGFEKSPQNPLLQALPEMDAGNFRDPFVFQHPETSELHMLVTTTIGGRGVLAHYVASDVRNWRYEGPILPPGDHHPPECPEHFFWNGWWYLTHSHHQELTYWVSRDPLGPWRRTRTCSIEGPNLVVPRTAAWRNGRRIAVGFLQWRRDGRDEGERIYGGNAVFRELRQDKDGTLFTRFVPEMLPLTGKPVPWRAEPVDGRITSPGNGSVHLEGGEGTQIARLADVPPDSVLELLLTPLPGAGDFGLLLRADENLKTGYRLCFIPDERKVNLQTASECESNPRAEVSDIDGLDAALRVTICMKGSVIDVNINERHTLVERCFNHRGTYLGLFVESGPLHVSGFSIAQILSAVGEEQQQALMTRA